VNKTWLIATKPAGLWHVVVGSSGYLQGMQTYAFSKPGAVLKVWQMALEMGPAGQPELEQLSLACMSTLSILGWPAPSAGTKSDVLVEFAGRVNLFGEDDCFSYFDGKEWLEVERPSRGFYKHHKGPVYFVTSIGILDEDGHGDPNAPRQVIYESTRSVKTGLPNLRKEEEWVAPVKWPDGVVRPRFVRLEYEEQVKP